MVKQRVQTQMVASLMALLIVSFYALRYHCIVFVCPLYLTAPEDLFHQYVTTPSRPQMFLSHSPY